jgi:hypothetical protein
MHSKAIITSVEHELTVAQSSITHFNGTIFFAIQGGQL